MGNVGIKKLFNFLHKTNFNAELQESNSINLANIIYLHINSINQSIYIYIERERPHVGSMRFGQVAHCMTSFSFRLPHHLNLEFMSNY